MVRGMPNLQTKLKKKYLHNCTVPELKLKNNTSLPRLADICLFVFPNTNVRFPPHNDEGN